MMITQIAEVIRGVGGSLELRPLGMCGFGLAGHDELAERWAHQVELSVMAIAPHDRVALVLLVDGEPEAMADCAAMEALGALVSLVLRGANEDDEIQEAA